MTLSRQERASGAVFGVDPTAPLDLPRAISSPRSALFEAVLGALSRSPCTVSFSGGWDSSVILAVATRAARVHGLPLPVPITVRFPQQVLAEESAWQELVIDHLGLQDWERIEVTDELDFLGEMACEGLRSHGLLWPANAHFHVPIFAAAEGGAVLTGFDGDGLFGGWRWARTSAVLARREPVRPRDALRIALACAPAPVRRSLLRARSEPPRVSWLTPDARRRFLDEFANEAASEPRRWGPRVAWFARLRWMTLTAGSLQLLADRFGAQVGHPLLEPRFLGALAADGNPHGYGTRAQTIETLFGDLLPPGFFARRTKAVFGRALWGPRARAFAETWDGAGLDEELVDLEALRRSWALPSPPLTAATVLQAAWLSAQQAPDMGSRRAATDVGSARNASGTTASLRPDPGGLPERVLGADVRLGRLASTVADPVLDRALQSAPGWLTADRQTAQVIVDGLATFSVSDGRSVVVDLPPGTEPRAVREWLHGPVATLILGQQGRVPLHATSVEIDGGAVAIAGAPAAGKSTAGLVLQQRGHRLVTDDLSPLDVHRASGRPATVAVVPFGRPVHVWPETVSAIGLRASAPYDTMPGSEKLALPAPDTAPANLRGIVVLELGDAASGIHLSKVPSFDAVPLLTSHVHGINIVRQIWPAQVFAWAVAVAEAVPVYRLTRPTTGWTASETASTIERLAAGAASSHTEI